MRWVWFYGWRSSPTHKIVYQITISQTVVVLFVSTVQICNILDLRNGILTAFLALLAFGASNLAIRFFLWKGISPYVTADIAREMNGPSALDIPAIGVFWLAFAMFVTVIETLSLVFMTYLGTSLLSALNEMNVTVWLLTPITTLFVSQIHPFRKMLGT